MFHRYQEIDGWVLLSLMERSMARVAPWHSKRTAHYHDNDHCPEGEKVPAAERNEGTGGRSQCVQCAILHFKGE